jgi:repressor LexA
VGLRSSQTVHHHLLRLESEGSVERHRIPGRMWSPLRLTEKGWGTVSMRPVLGRIAAGRGLEATASEEPYSLAAELLSSRSGRRRFLLEVKGDSMTGAGIEEGDLLVVEENPSPRTGPWSRRSSSASRKRPGSKCCADGAGSSGSRRATAPTRT